MENEQSKELKRRTKRFSIEIIKVCRLLPQKQEAWVIGKQLIRAGTSVGANYRAVCRARSKAEFISKMGVVVEEADESAFWLEIIEEAGLLTKEAVNEPLAEANELLAIFAASQLTAKGLRDPNSH